ncbi:unnamed protein product [Fraxinus pennsylvanica]|uniref:C2H2-type domain-containing protein n=1 Tax=Fraxinus pennsylvanica TaxID=56036 RepID=A0AAD2E8G6_9LAMI|nr:unnamed protein product [Fraxinus pennsylvanica]
MEQVGYWTWAEAASKRKRELSFHVPAPATTASYDHSHGLAPAAGTVASYGDSWEEQAFAEDASGPLGGCIWPPRSYNCSFCRREFRSAQALGGHMNVHRRDKARLRQSSVPQTHDLVLNPCKSFDFHEYPSHSGQIYTILYNSVNSDSDPVRVSDQNQKVSSKKRVSSHGSFFPIIQEHHKNMVSLSPPSSSGKKSKISESNDKVKEDYQSVELSESLNPTKTKASSDEEVESCKRRKIDAHPLIFFHKLSPVLDRCHPQSEMDKLCSISKEELDLELRLGVK